MASPKPSRKAAAATSSAAADTMGFRLILSDNEIQGGQLFRTYSNQRLISREQIVGLLKEHFGYDELLLKKGLRLEAEGEAGLHIVGFDGRRRVPIRSNADLRNFSMSVQGTKFPTVEVHLPPASGDKPTPSKSSQDRLEELEDLNKQLESSSSRVLRRVDDLERARQGDRDEMQRIINKATQDLSDCQRETMAPVQTDLRDMRQLVENTLQEFSTLTKTVETHDKAHRVSLKEVNKNVEDVTTRIQFQLAEMGADISRLIERQKAMGQDYDRLRDWLNKHDEEVEKLSTGKVDKTKYEEDEKARNERWSKDVARLEQLIKKVDTERKGSLDAVKKELVELISGNHAEHAAKIEQTNTTLTDSLRKLEKELTSSIETTDSKLTEVAQANHSEVLSKITANRQEAWDKMKADRDDLVKKITANWDELFKKINTNHEQVEKKMEANHSAHAAKIKENHAEARTKLEQLDSESKKRVTAVHKDLSKKIEANHETATSRADKAENTLSERISAVHAELQQSIAATATHLERSIGTTNTQLTEKINADVSKVKEENQASTTALLSRLVKETKKFAEETGTRLDTMDRTITSKDMMINKKADGLARKCETTFKDVHERMEEGIKAERGRLANIEKVVQDTIVKIRHDFRSETERLRKDYEQDTARLDGDLSDLHVKHDVVKQEINFFQSRLLEQKDWAQRQFMDAAAATKVAQVDSQEGMAASTKMLQALRDDAVAFREKMAKHISALQNTSDAHDEAIKGMESHKTSTRTDLDALIYDHKSYVEDMDSWAQDVKGKMERLHKALEPTTAEWQMLRAVQRGKELKRPLALKSPIFALQGLSQVQMEFFPNGHNQSPQGMCALRLLMPPGANVRFQCGIGRLSSGTSEFDGNAQGHDAKLSVDFFFEQWYDEIRSDGSLPITLEVLADYASEESQLTRCVHLLSH